MPHKDRQERLDYLGRYYLENKERWRSYRVANRERINAGRRRKHAEGRAGQPNRRTTHGKTDTVEYRLLLGAKKRAQRKGLSFNLSVFDIPNIPERCPLLNIPLSPGDGRMCDNSPTLDRIVPELGYVPGNVRILSWRANRLRSDATAAELLALAEDAVRIEAAGA